MCPDNLTPSLNSDEVEAAVRLFWDLFASKKAEEWPAFYAEVATIFATSSKRPEPARLVVLRRQREYLLSAAKMKINVGNVDVEILGPGCAVAAYTLRLHAEEVTKLAAIGEKISEEHLENARVTHVFVKHPDGRLQIVHEHISAPS